MIEIIKDLPPYVAGFKATGKVTKNDYERIVMPVVDRVATKYGKINFLLCIDTDLGNFTAGAWLDDILVGIKHFTHWNKIAIISHQGVIKKITDVFGNFIPGETRGFKMEDRAAAYIWIAEK